MSAELVVVAIADFRLRRNFDLRNTFGLEQETAGCGARTRACRIDTRVDTWSAFDDSGWRREESRRGTHECVRHVRGGTVAQSIARLVF